MGQQKELQNIVAAVTYYSKIDLDRACTSYMISSHLRGVLTQFILFSRCSVHFLIYLYIFFFSVALVQNISSPTQFFEVLNFRGTWVKSLTGPIFLSNRNIKLRIVRTPLNRVHLISLPFFGFLLFPRKFCSVQ